MNAWLLHIFESTVCVFLLFPVYWFFLRKETFFRVNRYYLLWMLFFSMLAPLLPFSRGSVSPSSLVIVLDPVLITPARVQQTLAENLKWTEIIAVVYITGVVIFFLRFVLQLVQLFLITRRFGIRKDAGKRLVFTDRGYSPFSFFNLVYINNGMIPAGSLPAIMEHENIHIRQKHTLDMILIEMAAIVQWFNPLVWMAGREMKIIHEYLADEGVLKSGISHNKYQQMILDETMGVRVNGLTNNFNVSILKKRIVMMTKSKSTKWSVSKLLFVIPALLLAGFLLTSGTLSNTVGAKTQLTPGIISQISSPAVDTVKKEVPADNSGNGEEVFTIVENQPEYTGGDEARVKFLQANIKYPEDALKAGIHGTVFVTFVVEKDGKITHVKVLRGIGKSCDEEAYRVVKMMPNWIPGKMKGKNVAVQYTLPIKFTFDSDKKKEPKKNEK
jgi:TonB family protein